MLKVGTKVFFSKKFFFSKLLKVMQRESSLLYILRPGCASSSQGGGHRVNRQITLFLEVGAFDIL